MAKKVKKKIRFKIIPILLSVLVGVLLYFGISYLIDTKIKNIYISGNQYLTEQEIIELAELEEYPSFYKTFSKTIKKRLLTNSLIKKVEVTKSFFNVLNIRIEENAPLFIMGDEIVLENEKKVDLFTCKIPLLTNSIPQEIFSDFVTEMSNLKPSIHQQLSEITYSPSEYDQTRFLIYMNDGNHVYINLLKFDNLGYYDEIYPTLNGKKGTLYLDSGNHFEVFT